ncbi:MAG TPA: hypothetical protein ENH82_14665 [bacterium]|nr:hypothetical protein [bacterium]
MAVLIACEESQAVTIEFRKLGVEAYSCDIQECSGGHPEWHIKGDVIKELDKDWDLLIAHPPCTYLCVPGAHYLHKQKDRWGKMVHAKEFFMKFLNSNIKRICVENSVPHSYADLPKYSQIIQPYQFGDKFTKRTCLWLKGLPPLQTTKIVQKGERYYRKDGSVSNSIWYAKATAKERSKTFPGIAKAMAEQWAPCIKHGYEGEQYGIFTPHNITS